MDAVVPRLLLFDASTTSVPVTVIINDDAILENNEEFFSLLSTTDAAVILDPQRANITIVEDSDGNLSIILLFMPVISVSSRWVGVVWVWLTGTSKHSLDHIK